MLFFHIGNRHILINGLFVGCMPCSGGSRIFPGGGCTNSQNCYYFSNFCRKLHENERIWTPGGPWRLPWIRQCMDPETDKGEEGQETENLQGGHFLSTIFEELEGILPYRIRY